MASIAEIDALRAELAKIMPLHMSGKFLGGISAPLEQTRSPSEWLREFLEIFDPTRLTSLKPSTQDIVRLTLVVNDFSLIRPVPIPRYRRFDGSEGRLPIQNLVAVTSYALLEMLLRILGPGNEDPSIGMLLRNFGRHSTMTELTKDLEALNAAMEHRYRGHSENLYDRVKRRRDQLVHGRRSQVGAWEGLMIVMLVDLILLHVMRDDLAANLK